MHPDDAESARQTLDAVDKSSTARILPLMLPLLRPNDLLPFLLFFLGEGIHVVGGGVKGRRKAARREAKECEVLQQLTPNGAAANLKGEEGKATDE